MQRFAAAHGHASYDALWRWSVEDLPGFWGAIADELGVRFHEQPTAVLGSAAMPGADWFPGATLSYAEHVLTHAGRPDDAPALHVASELSPLSTWTWGELRERVAAIRGGLRALGVGRGDRVCAYLPNLADTLAAMLATTSLGAIWSSAAPEFGAAGVIDRFQQLEPTVLLAVDGYRYGGRDADRAAHVAQIHEAVGGALVRFGHLSGGGWQDGFLVPEPMAYEPVPFDHPLWILYSSGTTGLPKAITHSHGGIVLEHLKFHTLHGGYGPGTRLFWFTTTGWMMWNYLVSGLLTGAELVLYDGSPAGEVLWDLAAQAGITTFGTSPAWLEAQRKAGATPRSGRQLQIDAVGCTGAPLAPQTARWIVDALGGDVWLAAMSGGTDVCTSFAGGVPTLPAYADEMQRPCLGARLEADDGELVITAPMPSMPVRLWGDTDGTRLRDAYFGERPGVWTHGDFVRITERGGVVITGRSDATINRHGVRIGTAELYNAVLVLPEVQDALVVEVGDELLLWVVMAEGAPLTPALDEAIRRQIREACSPRHVPSRVLAVPEIPRTLSGKPVEVPVKRILSGRPVDEVLSRDALANPAALDALLAAAVAG